MLEKLNPSTGPRFETTISDLRIYPIKSCRGISIRSTTLTRAGLDLDRRWMFVDASLKFVTIREISEMTLIETALASIEGHGEGAPSTLGKADVEQLVISISGTEKQVMVPARPSQEWLKQNTELKRVDIWGNNTDGYIYSDSINAVFTEFLGKDVKLVYKGPEKRIAGGNAAPSILGREEAVNFPDVLPILIANEASIRELNGRLGEKGHAEIGIERFRPNIIVRGEETQNDGLPKAWSEDVWKTVRIFNSASNGSGSFASPLSGGGGDDLIIDVQARCARCQVPNVHPDTAEKDQHEPWDTLVSYRRVDEGIKWKPCFGMLGCPRSEGAIKVGMKFEVLENVKGEHRYVKGF